MRLYIHDKNLAQYIVVSTVKETAKYPNRIIITVDKLICLFSHIHRQSFVGLFFFCFLSFICCHTNSHSCPLTIFSHVLVIWCPGEKIECQFSICYTVDMALHRSYSIFCFYCFRFHILFRIWDTYTHTIIYWICTKGNNNNRIDDSIQMNVQTNKSQFFQYQTSVGLSNTLRIQHDKL